MTAPHRVRLSSPRFEAEVFDHCATADEARAALDGIEQECRQQTDGVTRTLTRYEGRHKAETRVVAAPQEVWP